MDVVIDLTDNEQEENTNGESLKTAQTGTDKLKRKSVGSLENKVKQKTNAALQKEAKRQKVAADRLAKQTANELNKIYKPGECMKYMNVEIHPVLSDAWYMADVSREVSSVGSRVTSAPEQADVGLVLWSRTVPQTLAADGPVRLTSRKEQCGRALCVLLATEVAELVSQRALATRATTLRTLSGCPLTLAIYGVKDYFKSGRKTINSNKKLINEIELEMAITDLLVTADCDAVIVNTPNELALLIVQLTKAIAEAPHKKAKRDCDEQTDVYIRGDNKNCVSVDQDGNGVSRLWQQMIAILPHSSLETSRALCAKYENPVALCEALQDFNGVNELADIGVARAAVPGAKARKIGPEFARKLKTLFTAVDGNVLLE